MALLLSFFIAWASAAPFKIGVVAELNAMNRAQEFINQVAMIEPFKQLIAQGALEISVAPTQVSNLNCRGGAAGIPRLARCDLSRVNRPCRGMNFCPLFTSVPNIGAGHPRNPISSSSFPWTTMLHEMVHSFGFTDDYAYTHGECRSYCGVGTWNNGHSDNNANRYPTEAAALAACIRRIPWCQQAISAGTTVVQQIANGSYKIGSPAPAEGCPSTTLGVYLGGSCQNQNPNSTWRPNFCPTVMGHPSIGQERCEVDRRHAIISRSPNLLPPFYQKKIFQEVVRRTRIRGLVFRESPEDVVPAKFLYGMPELDRHHHPEGELLNLCRDPRSVTELTRLLNGE